MRPTIRYLFVDMNSFFASVEQQANPDYRGHPLAVVPVLADTTCCIAASIEAKAIGIRTGTSVGEAKRICRDRAKRELIVVVGRHDLYVRVHRTIVKAVGRHLPVDKVMSIDEMMCKLIGDERDEVNARAIGRRVKDEILRRAGGRMTCSVGIGPNRLLAKVAADMQKPDGLTVIRPEELPRSLDKLAVRDFPGIGPRMEKRLRRCGVVEVSQLTDLSADSLSRVWGSKVLGHRWWHQLRGEDVPDPPTRTRTVGHSHVLPPGLRTDAGARGVVAKLVHKAAARLRKADYWTKKAVLSVRLADGRRWADAVRLPACQDTPALLVAVADLWEGRPSGQPMHVAVTFVDLVPAASATPSLFPEDRHRTELSHAMDKVNRQLGPSAVYFGGMFGRTASAPMRIAFTRIPDEETESCGPAHQVTDRAVRPLRVQESPAGRCSTPRGITDQITAGARSSRPASRRAQRLAASLSSAGADLESSPAVAWFC